MTLECCTSSMGTHLSPGNESYTSVDRIKEMQSYYTLAS